MELNRLGINPVYVGPASQQPLSPKEAEEERRSAERKRGKRIAPKQKSALWTPNQKQGVDSNLAGNLQDFARDNNALFQSAIRIATFALDQRMSDVTMRLPISIGVASDPAAKSAVAGGDEEGLYLFLQVHLDHDLFGSGTVKVISDEEFEVFFHGGMSLPQFYASSEQDVLAYIASLGEERSHDLDTLREYIAEDPKDSDLEEIEDRLNRMLEDYHTETDELAERLIAALEEKGATYGAERERVPIITGLTPDDLYDIIAVKKDTPGVRNLLSQKAFKIENAGDDDPVYPLLNEYRAADFKRGAYLIRAIRDLTLSGITVTTERSFNGTHVSKARSTAEGKIPIVDVPALAYATNMTVAFTVDAEIALCAASGHTF